MINIVDLINEGSISLEQADFLPTIFGDFLQKVVTGTLPVVLYGAGSAGKELHPLLKTHGVEPVCFCDGDSTRSGETYCGLPVISIEELNKQHKDSLIFITVGPHREAVKKQLINLGFGGEKLLTVDDQEALYFYTHIKQWCWPQEDLVKYQEELLSVYNSLSDKKSKKLFISRIALFVNGADYSSFTNFLSSFSELICSSASNFQQNCKPRAHDSEAYLQFNNDVIRLKANETLVDGGAYTGDSTLEFIKVCEKNDLAYGGIFCFEPDQVIFSKLKENTSGYERVTHMPFGLWSHATTLRFADSSQLKPGSTKIVTDEDTGLSAASIVEIDTTSIDQCCSGSNITIIKLDIEGAEVEALRGAQKTIKRCRPTLIISVYHKRNDIFEIPFFIRQLVPEYKFYLRHFSNNFNETTLFAIL